MQNAPRPFLVLRDFIQFGSNFVDVHTYSRHIFFKLVCSFDNAVVLFDLFFKLFDPVPQQRCCLAVCEICAGQRADQGDHGDNDR